MTKWFRYLLPATLTTLLFILLAGVLGGTFDYFFAPAETNHDQSLTGCILGLLLPMLLTGLYLPLLLLWPIHKHIAGLPHTSLKPRRLFYRLWILLACCNPVTLLWIFSFIQSRDANMSLFLAMLFTLITSGAIAAYAGIFLVKWRTPRLA